MVLAGKRAAQGRATRGQLVEVATRLFADHGYEGTSIDAVLFGRPEVIITSLPGSSGT